MKIAVDQNQKWLHRVTLLHTVGKTKPLAWVSTADPIGHFDYPYAHIHQLNVEKFVIEINHGDFLIFLFILKTAKGSNKLQKAKGSFHTVHRVVARKA